MTRSLEGGVDAMDMAPGAVPRLMTAQEVAELLRVPRSTIYELARNRRIPFVKVGRRTLFVQQALIEWIAAQTVRPRE
jgi:excisionase family DNA binding protein